MTKIKNDASSSPPPSANDGAGANANYRFSSITTFSTDSTRSSVTLRPLVNTSSGGSSFTPPSTTPTTYSYTPQAPRLTTEEPSWPSSSRDSRRRSRDDSASSPNSPTASSTSPNRRHLFPQSWRLPHVTSPHDRRLSDLNNYRRDLAVLETSRVPHIQHNPPTATSPDAHSIAPWLTSASSSLTTLSTAPMSFYNNSDEDLTNSTTSQLSPGHQIPLSAHPARAAAPGGEDGRGGGARRTRTSHDSPESLPHFDDGRRPSAASILSASSQGSRNSASRGGLRKLQGFFGEEFPGRDSSDGSLPASLGGRDQRNRAYSLTRPTHRERNYSNASNSHTREASPSSSRPRTPVPAPEVVPFLYQDNTDIARYGEAPVRDILTGPDRQRYVNHEGASQPPPKSSSSARSGHSMVHLPGHSHRHNKSNDDSRALRPTASREDSIFGTYLTRDRGTPSTMMSRAQSPTPSSSSGAVGNFKTGHGDGHSSPSGHEHGKRGLLRLLRKRKDHDDHTSTLSRLRDHSTRSLQLKASKSDLHSRDYLPPPFPPGWPNTPEVSDGQDSRSGPHARGPGFNNKLFGPKKERRPTRLDHDESIGPTEQRRTGQVYHLDTNLNDMEGILSKPPALTPIDAGFFHNTDMERPESESSAQAVAGKWDAPDSWAVRRGTEEKITQEPDEPEVGNPPRPEEKQNPYFIRIFRSDDTFSTHAMPLESSVADIISQVVKKTYVVDGLENYNIILRKHELIRVLGASERPILLQKRLLQQIGYDDRDRIEDLGREDTSYLCKFLFLSARESDFYAKIPDLPIITGQKLSYVDLSGRNLITIPISLHKRAGEIISLNLSRNLSLEVPRDFIQSCKHLRDIKFNNNEARKLPASLSSAAKLTYLDVSNNRLEQLGHADLDTLTGIIKMNFANNRLKTLPTYFGSYRGLRTLNISSNFLDKFPPFLCELQSLVDLDLSFNAIAYLPSEIGNLGNLEKLLITNNRLSDTVPDSFADLTSLRELDIKYNSMTKIDIISDLPKLEILNASHNQISAFVGTFGRLRQLKLNHNPLNKFEIVEQVPTLTTLNLSHAQLASIDSAFSNMMNLEKLILDCNYFVSLPQQIGALTRLDIFSIAHNSVGELPPQIGCLTELRILNVRGNNISKLPMEIWWANKLEVLNASSNVLDNFPKPASRPPRLPGEDPHNSTLPPLPAFNNGKSLPLNGLSTQPSSEDLAEDATRRPSQASSSTLLSVGPSPVIDADRKNSVVSVYGKGGRKTSVVTRANTNTSIGSSATTAQQSATNRKDSSHSSRLTSTFAGSLRNLYLADNRLDDDVFDQITLLSELRVLNLSYNDEITDMPQRSIKSWPQLVELYLSGNGLTSLPADDLEESSLLQALYINGNKFTNLPADISRAKKLAVLDCGNNFLKYNISNVPYDWNWNLNPNLRYLNLSGNKRLEIKQTAWPGGPGAVNREQYTDFSRLANLRILGLMDVTLTQPSIPDQSEDRRVRTSGSLAGHLPYGMADTLGKNEHLSTVDLVVPRFNSSETEMLLGLFDGQALSSGGSKIAKYLHENFGHIFAIELRALKTRLRETPVDALRRAFLSLNKDLVNIAFQHAEERPKKVHRGSAQPVILTKEDLNSGGVATVAYLQGTELYVANVGDAQAMAIKSDGKNHMLTRKHDPAEPTERSRIREAGGWVSRNGRLNDLLEVSRAFGYVDLMPAVQAAPYISHMSIKENDDIILIATKELWEYLTPGLVTDIARAERQDLMRAAQKLRDLAIAYGASGKIMVMMISVADLKRRVERSRLHRGASMSLYPSGIPDEALVLSTRRGRKTKADVLDSSLNRLEAEIPAPTGNVSIVFTDIKNSTTLWEMYPNAMRSAIKLHNDTMRRQLRRIGGYEVKTEGDAFMVSFPTATSALLWAFAVQIQLLDVTWPAEVLHSVSCQPIMDKDDSIIFKGLSVRMGIHYGDCVSETDPVTRRMDYFGPMVNKASRISAVADGGQIAVSSDFISEIQRCLENYQDTDRNSSAGSEEAFDEESYAGSIRKDLRSLTSQGFEVKEMGEKKLKGLENPEVVYSLYPHALAGRIDFHAQHERRDEPHEVNKDASLSAKSATGLDPEAVWALWRVSLRLELLCSTLEELRGPGLQPPETELMDRMRSRGQHFTDRFLLTFMQHQVSRIETCVSTLTMRHLAIGGGVLRELNDLRAPMASVLEYFVQQQEELEQYRQRYGPLQSLTNGEAAKATQKAANGPIIARRESTTTEEEEEDDDEEDKSSESGNTEEDEEEENDDDEEDEEEEESTEGSETEQE